MRGLAKKNIGTQVHYIPVNRQPYYRQIYGDVSLPGANLFYDKTLSLPLHSGMSSTDVDGVIEALKGALDNE